MKAQDSFKGMPAWKGKGKGDSKGKGGKPPQQNPQQVNVAQQATSSSTPAPSSPETAHAEENWGYHDDYWTNDWSEWDTSCYGYDEYDWYSWPSYYVLVEEQAVTKDRQDIHVEDGQTNQRQYCFSVESSSDRTPDQSIRNAETSVASDSTVMHTTIQQSDIRSECIFLNYDHGAQQALLCEYVDLGSNPTYVIVDSGCTRAMGSRFAIDRLVQACQRHPKRDLIWFSTQPCTSKFSCANGEQSTVKERLVIHFRNDYAQNGWITTCVDILDTGKVLILFSVEQMRNLRMNIEHTPVGEFLTCPLFGMQRTALSVSTSNHPVLDIMALATSSWKPMHSFASEETTCPACAGKHRPHTYKEGCKKKPDTKKEEPKSAKAKTEPKPAEATTAKSVLKKILSPDTKLDVPEKPVEELPMKSSGQSSSSKDGIPACPEPQPDKHEVKTESKEPIKTEPVREPSFKGTLSLALQRIHEKLQSPTELLKLHLKHYHMSIKQFKKRTSALKLPKDPKDIYDKYEPIVKSSDTCSKAKIAPSRSKVSGIRSEVFGELSFIDHGEVPINPASKLQFLLIFDGATFLTTAYVVQNRTDSLTISHLQEYFETYQLNPKYIVADQAFMGTELEEYYNRQNISPISLGPGTPWPNRAEAAIRMFKRQVHLMLTSLKDDPLLANITYRQLLRQACISRNTMITHGGVTPVELAFGRRPADITAIENMTPAQLTTEAPAPERQIEALRSLAMRNFLEAR